MSFIFHFITIILILVVILLLILSKNTYEPKPIIPLTDVEAKIANIKKDYKNDTPCGVFRAIDLAETNLEEANKHPLASAKIWHINEANNCANHALYILEIWRLRKEGKEPVQERTLCYDVGVREQAIK